MAGNGWCTHPKRQLSSDVRILVRHGELACRNSWGNDFWEDRDSVDQPLAASAPPPPPVEAPSTARASYDDEVTSVVTSDTARSSRPGESDIVVEQTSLLPDEPSSVTRHGYRPEDLNEGAHRDQMERVDLMRRGSRDAIEHARERHRLRRGLPDLGAESEPDDEDDQPGPSASETRHAFAPDDYIETEGPSPAGRSAPADQTAHDAVIQEQATPTSLRARRLRRGRGEHTDPPSDVVPASEISSATRAHTTRHVDDPRFDSIPEIKPEIDLSRLRRREPEQPSEVTSPEPTTEGSASAYDEVLKRAQAIKAAARAEREARQQQARRPIAVPLRQREDPTPVAEPDRDPAPEVAPVAFTMDAYEEDGPGTAPEPEATGVQPTWLTPNPRIRFQRPHATETIYQTEDDWDADADVEPSAEPDEAFDEEYLPEPVVRRRWWRGLLPGRQRTAPLAATSDYGDEEPWDDDSFVETAVSNDAAYAESYDDAWGEDDSDLDTEASWDDESADEREEAWIEAEAEPASLMSTSDQAFEEDAHHFIERRYTEAPWRDEATNEEPANTTSAFASSAPSGQQRHYEPLDLDDNEGFSAFRSRLFAAPSTDEEPHATLNSTTRIPSPVPYRHEAEPRAQRAASDAMRAEDLLESPQDAMYDPPVDPSFDIRAIVAQQSDVLDMTIDVAPEVPRVCATCRSYRASEQGERGWCTNGWAFTHRQMVNADDLACQSTIGCWWLPADDVVWLDDEQQRSLTEPTPRVDRLVAHLHPLRRTAER